MVRKNKKTTKKYIIICLVLAMFFMGIGYSFLSSTLKVDSTTEMSGKWDIQIENVQATDVGGNAVSREVLTSESGLSAEFVVDLYNIGDYVEYTVVVKNKGNIKAKLDDIETSVSNSNEAIVFTHTASPGESIAPSESMEFKVKIAVQAINGEIQDSTDTIYKLTLNYLQDI